MRPRPSQTDIFGTTDYLVQVLVEENEMGNL